MAKRFSTHLKKWLGFLARPVLLFYALPYFMLLLIGGTFAQKYIGLYEATQNVFNSFILWVGFLPLPGGALVLSLILLNLTTYFLLKLQWTKAKFGTSLAHLGVILLLIGGGVTLAMKQEGFIILRHGQSSDTAYDYHKREFVIQGETTRILPFDAITEGMSVDLPSGDRIIFTKRFMNSMFDERRKLRPIEIKKDDEINQAGLIFTFRGKNYSLAEFSRQTMASGIYRFTLRRVSYPLPFSLTMRSLQQDMYPGDAAAKDYETRFSVTEGDTTWKASVAMNEPLRYRGYTLYQASVLTLPGNETASVLNAVRNIGWFFPYIATALIVLGLSFHVWGRRHAKK